MEKTEMIKSIVQKTGLSEDTRRKIANALEGSRKDSACNRSGCPAEAGPGCLPKGRLRFYGDVG